MVTIVDIIATLIYIVDDEIVNDCCYAFKHLTDVEEPEEELEKAKLDIIAKIEVIPKIISLIEFGKKSFSPALRIIGNLTAADNKF